MLKHLLGWRTSRKIIVIESDDWGSFRFKNQKIRDQYIRNYIPDDWMNYNDCFESYEDVEALSTVLTSVKDINNNSACFTFLMNPANPDFKKIEQLKFQHFYNESFLETLAKRKDGQQILSWYKEALNENLIEVGFHGREHLNVHSWMNDLNLVNATTKKGFKDRIWGKSIISGIKTNQSHRSTYNISSYSDLVDLKQNIQEGIELINETFNQQTSYFLPPDGPYHLKLNQTLVDNGIKYIGLGKLHNNPLEPKWYQKKMFWLGRQTKEGLKVITRNVIFEPASPKSSDWVGTALINIEKAFKYKHPAVISTHRANYTGTLNPNNRKNSLKQLESLLKQISEKWPNVEFMTSSQLGDTFEKSRLSS